MNKEQRAVKDFHGLIQAWTSERPSIPPTSVRRLRVNLIEEELEEFKHVSAEGDLVETADALGDLLYVVYGAGLAYGIDLEPVFAEIHRSNMTKGNGPIREDGKRLKGSDYSPPDLLRVLGEQ